MSKVIRIAESTFSRLQKYGTPLVDTPASVIEKILDHYESCPKRNKSPSIGSESVRAREGVISSRKPNLFLAPAHEENLNETVTNSISMQLARRHLTENQYGELQSALRDEETFHCWAMTRNNQGTYDKMRAGDYVLFSPTGTGKFSYIARVKTRVVSSSLGYALWPDTGKNPWELIYVLDGVASIDVDKSKLVSELGYKPNYPVQGVIRVKPELTRRILEKHGGIPQLVNYLSD